MAQAVGAVFADKDIAAAVNFSGFPLSGGGGVGCVAMDDNEACALDAAGCIGGCTGDALEKIAAFVSCNEKGWHEFLCTGGDSKSSGCVESAGIDADAYQKCKGDASRIKAIHEQLDAAGAKVHSFPKVTIAGHDHSMAQDEASLKQALCKEGVQPACGSFTV